MTQNLGGCGANLGGAVEAEPTIYVGSTEPITGGCGAGLGGDSEIGDPEPGEPGYDFTTDPRMG